jgi:outer membrane lipoprotein-sorting protein
MFLSNPVKIFHAAWIFSIVFAGCSYWRSDQNAQTALPSSPTSAFPFSLRAPEIFQAEIVIRTGENERQIFVARSGDRRRIDYDVGTGNHRAVILTDKEYLLSFKRKEFSERPLSENLSSVDATLTGHLLNVHHFSDLEEVSRDGSVIQYIARMNDSASSEVMIFFDQTIGLPVKQEFYAIEGETRTLQYTFELRGFKTDIDDSVFQIGKEFRKVNSERRQ